MSGAVRVVSVRKTCDACPAQWQGLTADGRHVYARFRFGHLRVGVGATERAAVERAMASAEDIVLDAEGWRGDMEYDELVRVTRGRFEWPEREEECAPPRRRSEPGGRMNKRRRFKAKARRRARRLGPRAWSIEVRHNLMAWTVEADVRRELLAYARECEAAGSGGTIELSGVFAGARASREGA